jgi:hypothetical protein
MISPSASSSASGSRPRHRKRVSALRMQAPDLPAYDDAPPEYPDSAAEGDADDDADSECEPQPLSPRRTRHAHRTPRPVRKSSSSASDSYLDGLLARSVHALEMSNALLASTHSTTSALSAVLRPASPGAGDAACESSARALSTRAQYAGAWAADLDGIMAGVQGLLDADDDAEVLTPIDGLPAIEGLPRPASVASSVSQSLPRAGLAGRPSHLELSPHARRDLVAPAPRALTIYIDSAADAGAIALPGTLGVRRAPHAWSASTSDLHSWRGSASTSDLHAWVEEDPDPPHVDPATPAPAPPTPSASQFLSALAERLPKRRAPSFTFLRTHSATSASSTASSGSSKTVTAPGARSRSSSRTRAHAEHPPAPPRLMTSIDELSSGASSSDSPEPDVARTLESLRRILADAPKPPPPPLPRPALLTAAAHPAPAAAAGTSHATASVSRLFTRGSHSSSARAPSPTRSVLKRSPPSTAPPTPAPATPAMLSRVPTPAPSLLAPRSRVSSNASSRPGTPRRIAFAAPPESYAASKPPGEAGAFAAQKARGRRRRPADKDKDKDKKEDGGWWTGWLSGAAGARSAMREEERVGRSVWGRPAPGFGGGGMDDWGV